MGVWFSVAVIFSLGVSVGFVAGAWWLAAHIRRREAGDDGR